MRRRIFVQIPAYRDRELLSTLRSLLETASQPELLRVAVAWQYGEDEEHLEGRLRQWGNVQLKKIPASESKGCNWARSLLQREWDDEEYTLLLDSHHRFVPGWDQQLIALFEAQRQAGVPRPILTSYLPPYDPHNDPHGRVACMFQISPLERHDGLLFRLTGHAIPRWTELDTPVPAHFVSLHFLFAEGSFNADLCFDPAIYFFADEVAVALRAYTRGYDLFHPHRLLGWHLYDRATRITHWSDHAGWHAQNRRSCEQLRALYRGELHGEYGVGTARSIADYERYIGLPLVGRGSAVH